MKNGNRGAGRAPHELAVVDQLRDFSTGYRLLVLAAMAPVVGTAGAAAAWVLLRLIYFVTNISYYGRISWAPVSIGNHLGFTSVLVPVSGCIVIGLMARYGSEKIRGHGIPEAMEAILIGRSRIRANVAILKPLSSAISIGTGGPFGAEGPIIMTGGAFGSLFAQLFSLSNAERKTLLVAGAAAGMAATFNTPVAAMLLAIELLLFEWKPRSFVPVAIASIVAAAWRPYLIAGGPLFPMPMSAQLAPLGLLCSAALGIIAGLSSGLLTLMVYTSEDLFQRLPIHWMWWPVFGGVVVGLGGIIEPHALGVGYDNIAALLHGGLPTSFILRLVAVKAVIWSVALGSGTSGGVLAPLLIIGGAIGALVGSVMPVGQTTLWALAGMSAMMGGTMRSPLTSIVFVLELTHNISASIPVAIAAVFAHATTVLLLRRSILTEKVARRGYHVMREYVVDPFEVTRAADVMAKPVDTLPADMPIEEALSFFSAAVGPSRHKSYPVIDKDERLVGMVTRADALKWRAQGVLPEACLGEVLGEQDLVTGFDDDLVGQIADLMTTAKVGRIPILRRSDQRLVGILARRDLLAVRVKARKDEMERESLLRLRHRSSPEK